MVGARKKNGVGKKVEANTDDLLYSGRWGFDFVMLAAVSCVYSKHYSLDSSCQSLCKKTRSRIVSGISSLVES